MLDAWHLDTRDEGPHRRDVIVLEKYLTRVIGEERDMEKATKIVRWLDLVVVQDGRPGKGQDAWYKTMAGIKDVVQTAVKKRGLGPLDL